MILKHKDDVGPQVEELERLLTLGVTDEQRKAIENEIWMVRAGAKGEKEAAYHIDFGWKDGKNSVVIHDLRLEHKGRVAQIDHLILHRTLECQVLESKGYGSEVRVNDAGEWEVRTRWGWKGIPSPVEQNHRHIHVLQSFIEDNSLAPQRIGLSMPLVYNNWVLVAPGCHIKRRRGELEQVVKMDLFQAKLEKQLANAGALSVLSRVAKMVSLETIENLGKMLIACHRPAKFNYAAKFGIEVKAGSQALPSPVGPPPLPPPLHSAPEPHHCENCGLSVEAKVVTFCRLNSKRFCGRVLCQKCQKLEQRVGCETCGAELEDNVISFCRFNSKRFGGRKLCRECQRVPVPA